MFDLLILSFKFQSTDARAVVQQQLYLRHYYRAAVAVYRALELAGYQTDTVVYRFFVMLA